MDTRDWHERALCPCGFHTVAPHGDLFHVHLTCCPECGRSKPAFPKLSNLNGWMVATMRSWIPTWTWWKFWTWGRGHWECKTMKDAKCHNESGPRRAAT